MELVKTLSEEFNLAPWQIEHVMDLLDEGNTIPFIARYRKEAHGSLDDQVLRNISDRLEYLRGLDKRREEVAQLITQLDQMTEEISQQLQMATSLAELEDIYRPFRPKRKTRASVAKERGLQPLAEKLLSQAADLAEPLVLANAYINDEKGVETAEAALSGAMDILAEDFSDNALLRKRLRTIFIAQGFLVSKAADPEVDSVYTQYYDFQQPLRKMTSHRVLAINRGEREGFLKASIEFDEQRARPILHSFAVSGDSPAKEILLKAMDDAYHRLIFPSIEREIRTTLTESASEQAIKVFSLNLRNLLMQPPVKGKVAMGLDPGYRTGCKVAVVDATGLVLTTQVVYPTHSTLRATEGKKVLEELIKRYQIEVIAIGNGTASKETERFVVEIIDELRQEGLSKVAYMVVSEAGASVYSASKLAAEEFPQFDVTLRSAVSIARRLQDPLAELVKIDPKAIGIGQYQHDMPKKRLDEALGGVVEDCVNAVGVDINTASPSLLNRIAGISATVSKNIVKYREENGAFCSRAELKKVPKLGPKAYEQCAGFLRVMESDNVLDHTGVHPESYQAASQLLSLLGYNPLDVKKGNADDLSHRIELEGKDSIAQKIGIGIPTLDDIVKELSKPGRDPRDELPPPLLQTEILEIKDLKPGMQIDGTVRNVIDFGAFVDIGVHQDGLVHISEICDHYIRHPSEIVKVGDIVKVQVLSVDTAKNRIALTMKLSKDEHYPI